MSEAKNEKDTLSFLTPKGRRITLGLRTDLFLTKDAVLSMAAAGIAEGQALIASVPLPKDIAAPLFEKKLSGRGVSLALLLRPAIHARSASLLSAMASVALCEAIESLSEIRCYVRWPNEICKKSGRRIAVVDASGALTPEGYLSYFILDLSIYLSRRDFPVRLSDTVTEVFKGSAYSTVGRLGESFLKNFFRMYENISYDRSFVGEYRERSCLVGKHAYLLRGGKRRRVTVVGTDDNAQLVVRTRNREQIAVSSKAEILF